MSIDELANYAQSVFESIKHTDEDDNEFWYARELQKVLEYAKWDNFEKVIVKAKEACKNSANTVTDHFPDVENMVVIGSGADRDIGDIALTRYACYLIVQNGDSRKPVIALGQTYFAVQTRQQELAQSFDNLTEDQKRLGIRKNLVDHNKSLAEAAHDAGVVKSHDYAIFQNSGYQGLYDGLGCQDIHARKGLKKSHQILDYMGSTELAANLFRATQTDEKLRREQTQGIAKANQVHYDVGAKVRKTIAELGAPCQKICPHLTKALKKLKRSKRICLHNDTQPPSGKQQQAHKKPSWQFTC